MHLGIVLAVFPLIFFGELPDKSMFSSLLLASRGRPLAVWVGAALAGAAGVVLAIPLAGCLSVSVRHWREYREIERVIRDHARSSRIDV